MKSRVRAMAPGFSFSFFSVVIATGSGSPAFKEPSAIAWSERHDMISVARSSAVAAVARVAVPRTIKQCDPSLRTFPVSSRKMRFDIRASAPRFVISVISGFTAYVLPLLLGGCRRKISFIVLTVDRPDSVRMEIGRLEGLDFGQRINDATTYFQIAWPPALPTPLLKRSRRNPPAFRQALLVQMLHGSFLPRTCALAHRGAVNLEEELGPSRSISLWTERQKGVTFSDPELIDSPSDLRRSVTLQLKSVTAGVRAP